jgi:hypothetical protein
MATNDRTHRTEPQWCPFGLLVNAGPETGATRTHGGGDVDEVVPGVDADLRGPPGRRWRHVERGKHDLLAAVDEHEVADGRDTRGEPERAQQPRATPHPVP